MSGYRWVRGDGRRKSKWFCACVIAATASVGLFSLATGAEYGAQTSPPGATMPGMRRRRDQQLPPLDAAAIERGQKLFVADCGFCHGSDATGARGPDLVRSKLVADDVGGNLIGEVIRTGRPQGGMPAFTMTPGQIGDIAAFLHSRVLAGKHSRSMHGEYPAEKLLTGNAGRGKAYFNGAGGCAGCHSVSGDLAHIAEKYPPLTLELRMLYARGVPSTVTVTEPSGKTVKGQLIHLDEFTVALRDDAGWYRSFSRNKVKVEVHDPLAAHQRLLGRITQDQMHDVFAYLETLK